MGAGLLYAELISENRRWRLEPVANRIAGQGLGLLSNWKGDSSPEVDLPAVSRASRWWSQPAGRHQRFLPEHRKLHSRAILAYDSRDRQAETHLIPSGLPGGLFPHIDGGVDGAAISAGFHRRSGRRVAPELGQSQKGRHSLWIRRPSYSRGHPYRSLDPLLHACCFTWNIPRKHRQMPTYCAGPEGRRCHLPTS